MWGYDCGKWQFFWSNFGYLATKKHIRDIKAGAVLSWKEKTHMGTLVIAKDDPDLFGDSDMMLLHKTMCDDYPRWWKTIGLKWCMVHGESRLEYPVFDDLIPSGRRRNLN